MNLLDLRREIDQIDQELLLLLGKRIEVVEKIGELKRQVGKPVKDEKRETEKIESLVMSNKNNLVTKEAITKVWQTFFDIAYEVEK